MSFSNHVETGTVTIVLASGDSHTLVCARPQPHGDNPRFLGQQIEAAMTQLAWRAGPIADTYGDQIPSGLVCARPPGVVEDVCRHCARPRVDHEARWSA